MRKSVRSREMMERENTQEIHDWIREIQRSDRPEIDKLREFFGQTTDKIIGFAEREVDLAKAMHDRESLIKVQIKMETLKSARAIFAQGYYLFTGRKAWDE
jgi:hypothetical protein